MSKPRYFLAGTLIAACLGIAANAAVVNQVVHTIIATTCTNQFVRSLAATGAATCATVDSSDLASSLSLTTPNINVATATTLNGQTIDTSSDTPYTPSVNCTTSTCTPTGRWHILNGKRVAVTARVQVSGSTGTLNSIGIPAAVGASGIQCTLVGYEGARTGNYWGAIVQAGQTAATGVKQIKDNANAVQSGDDITFSGVCEQ